MEVMHRNLIENKQNNQVYSANYQIDTAQKNAALSRFDSNLTITTLKSQ